MKGFKTIGVAGAITVIGGLQQAGVLDIIPEQYRGVALAVVGLIMAVLRLNTSTAVGRKN